MVLAVADAYANMAHECGNGETLSQKAAILAVADAYDAMTSDRPYRSALSAEKALEEIKRGVGTQFDPEVADAFIRVSTRELTGLGLRVVHSALGGRQTNW
jgi:HD-GYP domain-containing protein (c-di-GMP phosphodiesterase class II)